jgi:nucleotidyltransferase substrate binding protein (TIGR01987 family)
VETKTTIVNLLMENKDIRWNYLEDKGFTDVNSPKAAIKKAFETGLINNGHLWMELLLDRNLTAHTYDEQKATEVGKLIQLKYYPLLKELYNTLIIR